MKVFTMSQLTQYAALKSMLHAMERDLGLADLSASEKAILSAVSSLQSALDKNDFVSSRHIKSHPLCVDLPNPTFFRGLAGLLKKQYLVLPEGRSKGVYRLR
jgi:F0F1-type ATP synthase beta subunit